MIVITPYNTELFEDMELLLDKLFKIDYAIKQRKEEYFYIHQIWGNDLGFCLTINIYKKRKLPPIILN